MAIQRNSNGYSALPQSDPLADLDIGNPRKWAIFMEDFLAYEIAQAAGNPYTLTQTNCVDTIIGPTGVLSLTLGGADNDAGQLQLTETPFQTNSKRMFFEARWKLTLASGGTVAANEVFVGLASEQTTTNFMNAGGTAMTADDIMGFVSYDAAATLNSIQAENDVQSTDTGIHTIVDDTWVTTSFYYDGTQTYYYVDKALKSTLSGNEATSVVTPTLFIKGGEAKANVLNVDYVLVAAER